MMHTRFRTILSLVFAWMCLTGVAALADEAQTWGVMAVAVFCADRCGTDAPAHLAEYVQPIDKTLENDVIRVHLLDTICDIPSFYLAWTVENKTDELLYILCDFLLDDALIGGMYVRDAGSVFLGPGETAIAGLLSADSLSRKSVREDNFKERTLSLSFDILRPLAEIVDLSDATFESEEALDEAVERLNAEGKIVNWGDGFVDFGDITWENELPTGTIANQCVQTGRFEMVDTLRADIPMLRGTWMRSALADGQPIEQDNTRYALRVTQADLSPLTATIRMDITFPGKVFADAYSAEDDEGYGRHRWSFDFRDGDGNEIPYVTGSQWFENPNGGDLPKRQEDGTYVWRFYAQLEGLMRIPDAITLLPQWYDVASNQLIDYPGEALTLTFE